MGQIDMPGVSVAGATVVVTLAAWSTAPTWSALLASANSSTRAGVMAWAQPTAPYTIHRFQE